MRAVVSERTRYGDLTRIASEHLGAAAITLTQQLFPNLARASAAISAYADLHDALYRLGWELHGGMINRVLVPAAERRDAEQTARYALLEGIGRIATRTYPAHPPRTGVAGHWYAASTTLRTATDLLATHRRPMGQPRTPDSPDLADPGVAGPAWREYASLALTIAAMGEPLATRARTVGASPRRLLGLPWTSDAVTAAATRLHDLHARAGPSELRELEVAHPAVRSGDPVLELTDRVQHLHTAAWTHTGRGTMTVPTLTDLAAAGVLLHTSAHRVLGPYVDAATQGLIAAHGRAWRQVHTHLVDLRTIDPVPGAISADVRAIRQLLPDVEGDHRHDRVLGVLVDACRGHHRVAEWSAAAVTDLAQRRRLFAVGHALTGDDIGTDPGRVRAKLADQLTPIPERHLDNVLADLARAAGDVQENDESILNQAVPTERQAAVSLLP